MDILWDYVENQGKDIYEQMKKIVYNEINENKHKNKHTLDPEFLEELEMTEEDIEEIEDEIGIITIS